MSCIDASLMLVAGVTSSSISGCLRKSLSCLMISTLLRRARCEVGGRLVEGIATLRTASDPRARRAPRRAAGARAAAAIAEGAVLPSVP